MAALTGSGPLAYLWVELAGFTVAGDPSDEGGAAPITLSHWPGLEALAERHGAELAKVVGDAALVRVADAAEAVLLGIAIVGELAGGGGFPALRVGIDYGSAIERDGAFLGAAVTSAEQLMCLAATGEVLVTGAVQRAAGELAGVRFSRRGWHSLREVGRPFSIFSASREGTRPAAASAIDPVCRASVDPERCVGRIVHEGATHYFCSLACTGLFALRPDDYTAALG